jgi:hypothetical protein
MDFLNRKIVIMKWILLMLLVAFSGAGCFKAVFPPQTPRKTTSEWHKQVFSRIGLEIELPNWNAIINEQDTVLTIFAFPLVDNPVAGTQFGVVIQVRRMKVEDFRLSFEKHDDSRELQKWLGLEHLQADQNSNQYWVYSRKDIFSDGCVYYCKGELKRVGEAWELDKVNRVGPNFGKTAGMEMQRIFESIHIVKGADLDRTPRASQGTRDAK